MFAGNISREPAARHVANACTGSMTCTHVRLLLVLPLSWTNAQPVSKLQAFYQALQISAFLASCT